MEPNSTAVQPSNEPIVQAKSHKLLYILLTLVIAAAAAAGVYYWQHQKVNDLDSKVSNLSSQLASQSNATSQNPDLTKSTALVKTFYTAYIKNSSPDLIKQYGTSNLVFYSQYYQHGFNPIVCAQSTPDSIQVTTNKSTDGIANLTVTELYTDSPSKGTISVNVVNQGGLKIDSLTCGGTLGNLPDTSPPSN